MRHSDIENINLGHRHISFGFENNLSQEQNAVMECLADQIKQHGHVVLSEFVVECRGLIPRRCQVILPAQGKGRPRHFSPYRDPSRQQSTALSYPLASESPLVCLRFTQISLSGHNCRLIRHRWFFPVCKRLQPKAVCPCS